MQFLAGLARQEDPQRSAPAGGAPEIAAVEQAQRQRQHPPAGEAAAAEVLGDGGAPRRQPGGQLEGPGEIHTFFHAGGMTSSPCRGVRG